MSSPDAAPQVHQPLQAQLSIAELELRDIAGGLWEATGYNRDIIQEAVDTFPTPSQRRSDTPFSCTPEEEAKLRVSAAKLGPGRAETESLEDLGVYNVDAEIIESGQLHKTATEIWRTLVSAQKAPIIVFASDRTVPLWKKDQDKNDTDQVDAERLSTARLISIGGEGLTKGSGFFYRAGQYDSAESQEEARNERALALPPTEYEHTESFLGTALDEINDTELGVGYDPETGVILSERTGQVRSLGKIGVRPVILVHKVNRPNGDPIGTTDTMSIMGGIAAKVSGAPETVVSYWTSSTYKPSRWMSAIRAGINAAQDGKKLRVAVPTYGYVDLSEIKGETPKPPTIQNIASEMGKAAQEAFELRHFLDGLKSE